MKKLLALVLALVMTLSLCVTSNAAYTDAADVDYKEAVDVMTAVGVFQGADGKFSPKANLTREQAAKLIAYLDLGEEVAEALPALQVFNDVAADRWSSKYIAYCAQAGIIAGVGDGKFDPTGALTGYAFAKMLFCVLGYDQTCDGLTGSNWQINVAKLLATDKKLAKGVAGAASAALTREEAAQYCLNTLKATTVEAHPGTTTSVNGIAVTTSGSKATDNGAGHEFYKKYENLTNTTVDSEAFGRPAIKWTYKSKTVGTYADEPIATYTTSVTAYQLKTLLGVDKDSTLTITEVTDGKAGTVISEEAVKTAVSTGKDAVGDTGNGVLTEVYKTATDTYKVVCVNTYVGTIGTYTAEKKDVDGNVTTKESVKVTAGSVKPGTLADSGLFETADFEKADATDSTVVLYTAAYNGTSAYTVKSVVKAEIVKDLTVTSYKDTKVVAGESYEYSKKATSFKSTDYAFSGTTYNFVLDSYGYVIDGEVFAASASSNFVYVVAAQAKDANSDLNSSTARFAKAELIFIDGTNMVADLKITKSGSAYNVALPNPADPDAVKTYDLATEKYNNGKKQDVGEWFAYTENSDGTYTLEAVSATYAKVISGATLVKDESFKTGDYYTNSATEIVTIGDEDHDYAVTTKTGLVKATLTGKVLVTYAKDAKNISGLYAVANNPAASSITYAYAVEAGSAVKYGREWVFAIDGAQVTKVVATAELGEMYEGSVYKLTTSDNDTVTVEEVAFAELASGVYEGTVAATDTTFVNLTTYGTKYFGSKMVVFNVDEDVAADVGETATMAKGDTVKLILGTSADGDDNGKILAAYIVDHE